MRFLVFLLLSQVLLQSSVLAMPSGAGQFIAFKGDKSEDRKKAFALTQVGAKGARPSYALIAGVSNYPNMSGSNRKLVPAEVDRNKLISYFRDYEHFDEIVVLWDKDVTLTNIAWFLEHYFPSVMGDGARFVFAYSGHGETDGKDGYLILSEATSREDTEHRINMRHLKISLQELAKKGHHTLALVNACYAGALVSESYRLPADLRYEFPGAHILAAGGSFEETWHFGDSGEGSLFFEELFRALFGDADSYPINAKGLPPGDGLVSVHELNTYLWEEVRRKMPFQNPTMGDINWPETSRGGFMFLDRLRQTRGGLVAKPWDPDERLPEPVKVVSSV